MGEVESVESNVAANYGGGGVLDRVLAGARAAGGGSRRAAARRPETGRLAAHRRLAGDRGSAGQLDISRGTQVLDVGCGIGGAARALADQYGAQVLGIDLTPEFIAVAETLSRMTGVTGVTFSRGSALALPFEAERFDLAIMLHVGMNIADKQRLLAEVARVLRPGGRFAIFDIMRVGAGTWRFRCLGRGRPGSRSWKRPMLTRNLPGRRGFTKRRGASGRPSGSPFWRRCRRAARPPGACRLIASPTCWTPCATGCLLRRDDPAAGVRRC